MPLDTAARARIERIEAGQSARGFRLLAVAWKAMPDNRGELAPDDERDLVIAGFCVFVDPPKASAAEAISRLAAAGVRVKVVSGDHDAVVRHLVETLRIPTRGTLTGRDIDELTDAALIGRVETVDVFARVSPDQKTRIIRALQAHGHTVGFIGDGVNDAPAIRAAEVGISVEGATDVARAAADIILLAPDLGVLAEGVAEGRRTFANILKYVRMGTSSNFGNMLSMALASLVLPFLPLLPIQILLNNLFYDTSEIGIPFDRVDGEDLDHPRAWDLREVLRFTLVMGSLSSNLRLDHVHRAAEGLSRRGRQLPYRVVRRIDPDADPRHLHHPHLGLGVAEPTRSRADGDLAAHAYCRDRAGADAARPRLGLRRPAGAPAGRDRHHCLRLPRVGRDRQSLRRAAFVAAKIGVRRASGSIAPRHIAPRHIARQDTSARRSPRR